MSRIWFLVALAAGFVGGIGASIPLHSRAMMNTPTSDKQSHVTASKHQEHAEHQAAKGAHSGHVDHGAHKHGKPLQIAAGPNAPTLGFDLLKDAAGGWNLHIKTTNFRFSPETVNGPNADGEGHAHVYIDGRKIARVYAPWFHLASVPSRPYKLRVTLNANDHREFVVGGAPLTVIKTIK